MKELPPVGICRCGCGQPTTIATKSNFARGTIRGEPQRFVQGHGGKRHQGNPNGARAKRRVRTEASIERNRRMQEGRNRARQERAERRKAEQERRAKKAQFMAEATPYIKLYRTEKAKRVCDITPLIEAAKLELARLAELERPRRGRPKKVVNG